MKYGMDAMTDLLSLPLRKRGVKVHYEGSIDKKGGNADWDWYMFRDPERDNEWVIFDVEGPGCIYNMVQHRYPVSEEPTFRFFFDGETTPRFTLKHSEFGEKHPFLDPVGTKYIGPLADGYGPIRVVRSFVPMPFAKSCRITCNVKLEGNDRSRGEGGWGHVIYHTFSDVKEGEIRTFDPNDEIKPLIQLWKKTGSSAVIPFEKEERAVASFTLAPGETRVLFDHSGAGLVSGIRMITGRYDKKLLEDLWVTAYWNGAKKADVDTPFGCFFTNEIGNNSVKYLLSGMYADGEFYNNYPMPFGNGGRICLSNRSDRAVTFDYTCIRYTEEYNDFYAANDYDVFRTSSYCVRKHTEGKDSHIAHVEGSGHLVAAVITGYGADGEIASCEGDVHVHIDGIRTPQIESDGSESHACYGWGFPTEPECNPTSGYDGIPGYLGWSETRCCMGDWYPFRNSLDFYIESAEFNNRYMEHSGTVFYYGRDKAAMEPLFALSDGGEAGKNYHFGYEVTHGYVNEGEKVSLTSFFEGDDDDIPFTFTGTYGSPCGFDAAVPKNCRNLMLRRVSDQKEGRQLAEVYVNGEPVTEYRWYFADSNPYLRWLEDEFVIPSHYTEGKESVRVEIRPVAAPGCPVTFNVFGMQVFSISD